MAIDPIAGGVPSAAHVSLHEAGQIARGLRGAGSAARSFELPGAPPRASAGRRSLAGTSGAAARSFEPHTPIRASGQADPDRWDGMLNRLGAKYNVPPLFLKAVMLSESGGDPNAIGDNGHSVGLFQLHDQGYGHGMGDLRFDPEANAERAVRGLAEAWHAVTRRGYSGEEQLRAAYDYSFNPGGGWAYQGDSVIRHYKALLAEQRR
ncbi:MAG: lytic transglycosylase domain-containing protein [Dehalococcoidia bacterium]|nr:lytic transglycosylase domain-containing protein [Dehalococcoidia bacterium]